MALDPQDQGPQDQCGVFGVWAPGEDVAKLTYFGLYALQHRGQESAGIAVSNSRQILVYKDMGLVSQVFDESTLDSLQGHLAIGHARYSTTGASTWENAQPTFRPTMDGSIALGHNGNLINTHDLRDMVAALPERNNDPVRAAEPVSTNDTSLLTELLAHHPDCTVEQRALDLPDIRGRQPPIVVAEDLLDIHNCESCHSAGVIDVRVDVAASERTWRPKHREPAVKTGIARPGDRSPSTFLLIDEDHVIQMVD